jgi:hypothetical protein
MSINQWYVPEIDFDVLANTGRDKGAPGAGLDQEGIRDGT